MAVGLPLAVSVVIGSPTRDLIDYTLERILFFGVVLLVIVVAVWVYAVGGRVADRQSDAL
jgi:hypothetical protein